MHEIHLLKDLLKDLLGHAKAQNTNKISRVYIRMGEFTEINPEILKHFFVENTKGTIAENAELSIEKSQIRELRLVSYDCC